MPDIFYPMLRSMLFKIDPERTHHLILKTLSMLSRIGLTKLFAANRLQQEHPIQAMGLTFPNPIGLAAGLDKDGIYVDALASLGFGFIEIGTLTPYEQKGNPRPRIFRLPEANALINRMGFNNVGINRFIQNIRNMKYRGIIGVNIGKNFKTPIDLAVKDYLFCLENVYKFADYIAINISSPNTINLRSLQHSNRLDRLLKSLNARRHSLSIAHGKRIPLVLKISPDLEDNQIHEISSLIKDHEIDGVIACNTTTSRKQVHYIRNGNEIGGLSGAPVFDLSNRVINKLRSNLDENIAIIGVGGIMSGRDAQIKIDAGANLVQIYTGLIYRGPRLVQECIKAISRPNTYNP